jgi:hypothetical protein
MAKALESASDLLALRERIRTGFPSLTSAALNLTAQALRDSQKGLEQEAVLNRTHRVILSIEASIDFDTGEVVIEHRVSAAAQRAQRRNLARFLAAPAQ